ncbi:chemotaxis protein CheW [Actinotalea sp. K2]|uniref:chemotaxis protein CheW n=1 Tax=Actinotalea sp. K2 TaxID=2939438 RepID=UPI0020173E51|nr:chemotaxis protein CheW [Actinotalea sp. K2]MCL3860884.1 chemotaxis protein CheW [Actinotalea sp. K2]
MDEIVHEFLVESHENLDQLDSDLVALEVTPGARDLLSSVFRTIHTIKGTSGFLAYNKLEKVTHAGENLLVELRDGRRTMDQPTTNVLLRMVDTVRAILGAIEAGGTEGDVDVAPVVAEVLAVLEGRTVTDDVVEPAVAAPAEPAPAEPAPAEPAVVVAAAPVPPAAPAPARKKTINAKAVAARTAAAKAVPTKGVTMPASTDGAAPQPPAAEPAALPATASQPPAAPSGAGLPSPRTSGEPQPVEAPAEAAPAAEVAITRSAADGSIRVDVDLLDALMRQVGELVLARNAITRLADGAVNIDLVRASQRLSLIASELQEGVMKTRMQPIEHVWSKVPRMVRDLAAACDRQVRLEMLGGDTELDRSLLEAIKDPLTHLIRNAIDHGIEPGEDRAAAGKPAQGKVTLRASHAGGQVVVEIMDDGRGIDTERVAAKAVERGLRTVQQVTAMSSAELLQLLFLPGFSTAEAVTNVSGRGVGMDVVRTKIEAIGGTVDVESVLGKGTTWRLRIPLTLAIMPALTIECDKELYAIPQVSLLELVALDAQTNAGAIEYIRSAPVYRLRGELLPLVDLREVFGVAARPEGGRTVIAVLQADTQRFGLVVDRVLNTEEIVVKPLSARLKAIGLYAGATLLGDGRVSLILDVQAIARRSMAGELGEADRSSVSDRDVVVREVLQVLVAGIGGGRRVAIPLAAVTRLETLAASSVEHVGGREVVQYRGSITPVVRLSRMLGGQERDSEHLTVVVYTRGVRSVAIVVDEIIDIVDDESAHHSDLGDPGLTGSTVLKDRVTELLDVEAVVASADPLFFATAADAADLDGSVERAALNGISELVGV